MFLLGLQDPARSDENTKKHEEQNETKESDDHLEKMRMMFSLYVVGDTCNL